MTVFTRDQSSYIIKIISNERNNLLINVPLSDVIKSIRNPSRLRSRDKEGKNTIFKIRFKKNI